MIEKNIMIILENANFNGKCVSLVMSTYTQGNSPQLRTWVFDDTIHQMVPHATLTTNLPGFLKKNEVAIKEGNENENLDVLAFLYAWDIVDHPHQIVNTDTMADVSICKLKIPIPK